MAEISVDDRLDIVIKQTNREIKKDRRVSIIFLFYFTPQVLRIIYDSNMQFSDLHYQGRVLIIGYE